MYLPQAFREERLPVLHDAIRRIVFATLVTAQGDEPEATLLPLLFDDQHGEKGRLLGHVARANGHWKTIGEGRPALVLFQGEQAYVSPTWYPSKQQHGRVVPTWNYVVVEVRGTVRAFDDPSRLRALVGALTNHQESGRESAWKVDDAPADFVAAQLRGIVGIEVTIGEISGKWKMSQNRQAADRIGVAAGLAGEAAPAARAGAAVMSALDD